MSLWCYLILNTYNQSKHLEQDTIVSQQYPTVLGQSCLLNGFLSISHCENKKLTDAIYWKQNSKGSSVTKWPFKFFLFFMIYHLQAIVSVSIVVITNCLKSTNNFIFMFAGPLVLQVCFSPQKPFQLNMGEWVLTHSSGCFCKMLK